MRGCYVDAIDIHHSALLHNVPPLSIGIDIHREMTEDGMPFLQEKSHSASQGYKMFSENKCQPTTNIGWHNKTFVR